MRKLSPVKLNWKGVLKQITNSLLFVFFKNGALFLLQVIDGEADNKYPYVLEVKGYVGKSLLFSNSTNLSFDPKGCTTFIQTDKLNYLPGQVVKIRAVSILYNGKPANSSVNITITVSPTSQMLTCTCAKIHSIHNKHIIVCFSSTDQ